MFFFLFFFDAAHEQPSNLLLYLVFLPFRDGPVILNNKGVVDVLGLETSCKVDDFFKFCEQAPRTVIIKIRISHW